MGCNKSSNIVAKAPREYSESYCIIENRLYGGKSRHTNGWKFDNRFEKENFTGANVREYYDTSDEEFMSFIRDFRAEDNGIFKLNGIIRTSSKNGGVYIALEDKNEERLFGLKEKGGKWALFGLEEIVSDLDFPEEDAKEFVFLLQIDYDLHKVTAIVNNTLIGCVSIPETPMCRFVVGTNKIGTGFITLPYTYLRKNYVVFDQFLSTDEDISKKPFGWDMTGDFSIDKIVCERSADVFSIKAESKAGAVSKAFRKFDPVCGKFAFETYILLPEKADGASVSLMSGEKEVFKFETKNDNIVMGENVLNDYIRNIWQTLYIEADTNTGKAIIKVNGKVRANIEFTEKFFDGVEIVFAPKKDAVMWFDDVTVYTLCDHEDYPVVTHVPEKKYNVGVNCCWLWRDTQSGEGWDSVTPFPEFEPYTGYFDEGSREVADWELKFLAEHGVGFIHACWYAPFAELTAPIKRTIMSHDALHSGYMNAKYSNLVNFCIMWENGMLGEKTKGFDKFVEYTWNYWMEHYFKDERYARIDNKAVISFYNIRNVINSFGGVEGAKKAIEYMNNDLKKIGYDGMLILSTFGYINLDLAEMGIEAIYAYNWQREGFAPNHQIQYNRLYCERAPEGVTHIPTVSLGFNDVGRNFVRSPIITKEDFVEVCKDIKDILDQRHTGTWRDNTLIVSTLNEFSEGTYVYPTRGTGFRYLESIREVFTDDKSDHTEVDAMPTEAQRIRTSRLYPPNSTPIRRLQLEQPDGSKFVEPVLVMDMSDEKAASKWQKLFGVSELTYDSGVLKGKAATKDTAIHTDLGGFDASLGDCIHVRMKLKQKSRLRVYFITEEEPDYTEDKGNQVSVTVENEFCDYYVSMSNRAKWRGKITNLRISPTFASDDFEISLVEILSCNKARDENIVCVNGRRLPLVYFPIKLDNGDLLVAGEAVEGAGFYSTMRLYYHWNRFEGDGVLIIKSPNDTKLEFRVGSDKVLVNGVEEDLGYKFYVRDGLPVFGMKKLCDLIGYKYTTNGNVLDIIVE